MPKKNKKTKAARNRYYDYNLVAIVVLLTCFGLVMLYSTSAYTAQVNYENDMQFFWTSDCHQYCQYFDRPVYFPIGLSCPILY